jgi:hypothetical protein
MKRIIPLCISVILMPAILSAQTTIFNDSWADGGRNNGADPQDTDWWTSTSSQAIEVWVGYLGLVTTTTSGRGIHGTFGSQALGIGDTLTASFTFNTPTTIGSAKQSAFRIGLFDTTGKPGLAADLSASSGTPNPIYNGVPGYMMDFDVNYASANIQFREHDLTQTTGQLMANTTPDYLSISSGGGVYSFTANTSYKGVLSLKRTGADTLDLTGSLYQGATLLSTYTGTDASGIVSTLGMLAFHVTSGTFGGATGTLHPDNGIDFTNIKIEYAAVPEPSTIALLAIGAAGLLLRRRLVK